MNWLVLSYFLMAGVTFNQSAAIQDSSGYHFYQAPQAIATTLGAELLAMDHLFLSAEVRTEETYSHGFNFSPFMSEYTVKVGLRFGGFEFGLKDNCLHPTLDTNSPQSSFLYSGSAEIYLSFKGSTKLF